MRFRTPLLLALALVPPVVALDGVAHNVARAGDMAVVYCDIDKVVSEVDEGKEAQDALKKEQIKRQTEIQARETEIRKLQDELEKQAKAFSKEAIEKKAALYQQALGEYQAIVAKYNKELGDKERELFDPVEKKLKELLRTVANRDGYDLIISKRSVPYGRKDLDLTDKIIQEYNKAHPVAKKPEGKPGKDKDDKVPGGYKKAPAPSGSTTPKMK